MATGTKTNGKTLPAKEAAEFLGCSYSYLAGLLQRNKLKAEKDKDGTWQVDKTDLERAKKEGVGSGPGGRVRATKPVDKRNNTVVTIGDDTEEMCFTISKEKLSVIKLAFRGEMSLANYLQKHLEDIYERVNEQLTKAIKL